MKSKLFIIILLLCFFSCDILIKIANQSDSETTPEPEIDFIMNWEINSFIYSNPGSAHDGHTHWERPTIIYQIVNTGQETISNFSFTFQCDKDNGVYTTYTILGLNFLVDENIGDEIQLSYPEHHDYSGFWGSGGEYHSPTIDCYLKTQTLDGVITDY